MASTDAPQRATPLSRAMDTIKRLRAELDRQRAGQRIAVVGIGLRFPGGVVDLNTYWDMLAGGRDIVAAMSEERMGPFAPDWAEVPHLGGFLPEPFGFDAEFFGIRSHEARSLDPQHRLLLEVAWEAMEDAALPPDRIAPAQTGLFLGITNHDYDEWRVADPEFGWAIGNAHCFAAGRAAYTLGLNGPTLAVDTACSSSLVAVHLARQALARGECDVALAGGVNLIVAPQLSRMMAQSGLLAPDGVCKPFDARANGFTRSDGCAVVVLKRLDDAIRDNDRIHAVIRGSAVNHDGRSTSISAPNVLAQIDLIRAALADAELDPADIGMLETHGTGTALGDPIEMEAVVAALGRRNSGRPLHIGAVKANLGHLEPAAGIAGLIKAILCLRHDAVPPLVHFRTLNPRIDLSGTGITLPTELTPWPAASPYAAVNSFGLSGTNAQVVLGRPEPRPAPAAVPVTGFAVAARSEAALRTLAVRYRDRLGGLADGEFAAFAYTATYGRARQKTRAWIGAADRPAAIAALTALADGRAHPAVTVESGVSDAGPGPAALPRAVIELPHYPWAHRRHAVTPRLVDVT